MAKKYRIVEDGYAGYEVQARYWWWPFWAMVGCNTHCSVERAEEFAKKCMRGKVVKYL